MVNNVSEITVSKTKTMRPRSGRHNIGRLSLFQLTEAHPNLRAFFQQIRCCAWDYDHISHRFSFLDVRNQAHNSNVRTQLDPNPLEDFLAKKIIHPESIQTYRIFVRKVLSGERFGGAAMRVRLSPNTGYLWYYVSFRTLFSTEGHPVKTVGALARINPDNSLPRFIEYYKLHKELLSSLCMFARVNLSENTVDRLWLAVKSTADPVINGVSYTHLFNLYLHRLFTASAQKRLGKTLSLDSLLAIAKKKSPYWVVESSRIVEGSSYVRPIVFHVLLDQDEFSGHYYAFFYVEYVDHLYAHAGEYYVRAKRLNDSGIFSVDDANTLQQRFYEDDLCWRAYAVVRVCCHGHTITSNQRNFIAGIFGLFFESTAFVSQLPEGLLGIFMPNCESTAKARKSLEAAFLFVHRFLNGSTLQSVFFTAAYTQGKLRQKFQDEFVRNTTLICERLEKRKFCDTIEYISSFSKISELKKRSILLSAQSNEDTHETKENALTPAETKILIEALNIIIATPSADACLRQLLDVLGCYYCADRVYTVQLINDGRTLEQVSEWGKHPRKLLKGLISGSSLSKFPLFERVFTTGKPVLVNRIKRAEPVMSQRNVTHKTWSCVLVPLFSSESDFKGLLCVDNPTSNIGRISLIEALTLHLLEIHNRLLRERYNLVHNGPAYSTIYRGFSAFQDRMESFSSESYASIGIFVAAVPKLLEIVNKLGLAHSKAVLHFLNEFLPSYCPTATIFNTHEHEFVVVMPNTTKEFFFERITQIRRKFEERFPNQIALGATWSKGLFSGPALVNEARAIMLSQKHSLLTKMPSVGTTQTFPDFADLPGRFTIFYQPKVDMLTQTVIGAEALVRGIDESGNIVPPGRFIAELEKSEQLRILDLFVLFRVLRQLSYWKQNGLKLLPISINFSRNTFVANSTLGAVLALLSNFDDIDPSLVEIEIAETGYEIGASTLDRTMRPYLNQGLRFALDDFGSGYANLSIFSEVHFQTIKLDRSLIQNLNNNPISQSLIESIVKISHDTDMLVIAEGVEDEQQAQILMQRGCRLAQGYLYGRPTDAISFTNMYLVPHLARA